MINLHIIGDSHARPATWGNIHIKGLNIITHWIIDKTCAAFGIEKPSIHDMGVNKNDWVCFCFGEIDCRNNIGKNKATYKQVINKIVENYFYTIRQYEVDKIFVFNVVPVSISSTAEIPTLPNVGTDEERKEYVRYFNECLKSKCIEFGLIYFDVFDKYSNKDGYFNLTYRDNSGHIKNPIFLIEFLRKYINPKDVGIDISWTDSSEIFREFCLKAANNNNIFSTFRRNPIFTQVMEHFNKEHGEKYFNVIKKNHPELLSYFNKFKTSETVGFSTVFRYNNVLLSPSTLRYIKVFSDISDCFGSLEGFKIAEIGGGYGGQCKIIKDMFNVDYYFIDLPEVNQLARKYLSRMGITDVKYYTYENLVKNDYDLVISNHAFSELNREIQDYYNEMIIKQSKRGFMTCNVFLNGNNGYQIPDYEKMGKVNFMDEIPNTHPHNFIVYWNE